MYLNKFKIYTYCYLGNYKQINITSKAIPKMNEPSIKLKNQKFFQDYIFKNLNEVKYDVLMAVDLNED